MNDCAKFFIANLAIVISKFAIIISKFAITKMAAPKEIGRKPNGMGECRPSCGCVKTTSWKYHSIRNIFSSKFLVPQISIEHTKQL